MHHVLGSQYERRSHGSTGRLLVHSTLPGDMADIGNILLA